MYGRVGHFTRVHSTTPRKKRAFGSTLTRSRKSASFWRSMVMSLWPNTRADPDSTKNPSREGTMCTAHTRRRLSSILNVPRNSHTLAVGRSDVHRPKNRNVTIFTPWPGSKQRRLPDCPWATHNVDRAPLVVCVRDWPKPSEGGFLFARP